MKVLSQFVYPRLAQADALGVVVSLELIVIMEPWYMHCRSEEPLLVCHNLNCRKANLDLDANRQEPHLDWGELRRKLCSSCFNII